MARKPTSGLTLGSLRLTFERHRLEDVRKRAPMSKISQFGDAGESVYWLCFTLAQPRAQLWIASHGEMGGPAHAITGVTLTRVAVATPSPECPVLPRALQPVEFGVAPRLGATEAQVAQRLGRPSHRAGTWWSYDFLGKLSGTCPEGFDVMNWLVLGFSGGAVETIHAGQITSC